MKTVFIFGAGISKQAGAPLMADFLDKAEHFYKQGSFKDTPAQDAWEQLDELLHSLQSIHYKSYFDSDNIESIFGAVELGKTIGGFGDFSAQQLSELSESIKEVIAHTIEKSILYNFDPYMNPPQPYDKLHRILDNFREKSFENLRHLSFLTFNYDTALETALQPTGYSDIVNTNIIELPTLLKLHGSINWGFCQSCGTIFPVKTAYHSHRHGKATISVRKSVAINRCCDNEVSLLIVPPTWNKASYHTTLTKVWQRAAQDLKQAENIFIAGYSLPETDAFFRYLFALGSVGPTRIKRFWVFDPDTTGEVENRFRKMIGKGIESRFKFHQQTFDKALDIMEQELKTIYNIK